MQKADENLDKTKEESDAQELEAESDSSSESESDGRKIGDKLFNETKDYGSSKITS